MCMSLAENRPNNIRWFVVTHTCHVHIFYVAQNRLIISDCAATVTDVCDYNCQWIRSDVCVVCRAIVVNRSDVCVVCRAMLSTDQMYVLCVMWLLSTDQMYVFFSDVAKVGIKPIKLFIQRMEMDQVSHAIIVVQDGITPSAKQVSHCIYVHCYIMDAYCSLYCR